METSSNFNMVIMKRLILGLLLIVGFSVQGQIIGLIASQTLSGSVEEGTPVLANFHIDNDTPTHVEFDSSADATGLTTTGIVVSGKTVSSVTLDGDKLGGYFTVSTPFTFWDNNTIRLGEVTDTSHSQSVLYNFTLEYIVNNISEPDSPTIRYAVANGLGTQDGLTEANAWSYAEAFANATSGMTVWMKAGEELTAGISTPYGRNGLIDSPIKFIGYKSTIGDISTNYWDMNDTNWSSSEMPTLKGNGATYTLILRSPYCIIRNFQVYNATNINK